MYKRKCAGPIIEHWETQVLNRYSWEEFPFTAT